MIDVKASPDIKEIQRRLGRLQSALQAKVVHSSLVYAIKPVKASMKQLLPEQSGDLRSAVGHKKLSKGRKASLSTIKGNVGRSSFDFSKGQAAVLVGPNKKVNGLHQAFKAVMLGVWYQAS